MRFLKYSFILVLLLSLTACTMGRNTKETAYEKINKKYIDISDYTAEGKIIMHSNKTQNEYDFTQYYKKDNKFLLKYKDNMEIVFSNENVLIRNGELKSELVFNSNNMEYKYFFVNSFFKRYFNDENVTVKTNSPINEKYIILECSTDGKNFKHQKIWIDIKTVMPQKLEIYDENMNKSVTVLFESFKFDNKIDDAIFEIPTK